MIVELLCVLMIFGGGAGWCVWDDRQRKKEMERLKAMSRARRGLQ